jgi:putative phage-type endonuclease
VSRLEPGSPEWIALRRTGLGGTDLPKILGVSRFGGPMSVFMEKQGLTAPLIETEAMEWGKLLEEPVARKYALKSGRKVRRAAGFIRHPAYNWLYANVDRWSDQRGTARRVLECKTAGEFNAKDFGEPGSDQVPPDYLLQVMHYLNVTGKDVADLAVLIGGQKHRVFTIERDAELIERMTEIAFEFWTNKEAGIPPEIDGSEGSSLYLSYKYRDTGVERPMDDDLAMLATKYAALKAQTKDVADEITLTGNLIRDLMGNGRWAEGLGVRVVYSEVKGRSTVQWDEIVKARSIPQAVIEEWTNVGAPTRALTVTMKGDV